MVSLFRLSLTWQMVIATICGILFGIFFGDICTFFEPWASAYIMILKVTAVPFLIGAIIHGVGQLAHGQAKEIVKKGVIFIGLAWAINIASIYLTAFLFPIVKGHPTGNYAPDNSLTLSFAELLIPENIFYSLTNNIVPSVVIFSLLIGASLMFLKEKHALMSILQSGVESLTMITGWISQLTPIGTFLIIANKVGTMQLSAVQQISTYVFLYIIGLSVVIFWIFPRLISMLTPISAMQWLKNLFPILLLAYTTNLVIVCVPYIIALIQKEVELVHPHDEKAQNQIQGTVSIIFNLPLGSIFITLFIFFIALFYHVSLPLTAHFQLFLTTFLTSLGAIGMGSWLNSLSFLIDSLGLPIDAVDLYLTTIPFTSGFQSMVSAMEISALSLLTIFACRKLLSFKWHTLLRKAIVTAAPVLLLAAFVKWTIPLPSFGPITSTIYEAELPKPPSTKLFSQASAVSPAYADPNEDALSRILRTKTLRIGYNPNVAPFCFYNRKKELIGYDVAFALQLASDLDCKLLFIPLVDDSLSEELNRGRYDIAMSAVSITEERLQRLYFTLPYVEGKIALVTQDHQRKKFADLAAVKKDKRVKIAVLKGSHFERLAKTLFPQERIVPLENYDLFANMGEDSVLILSEPQAISWTIQHPHFSVVLPTPPLGGICFSYAVASGQQRLLNYLNEWLILKENAGFTETQRNFWLLGQINSSDETPRWSIVRNVLHWVD